jgi:large conductance mechanosensitive channel
MLKGFKEFAMRGNAIDLAVAFVVGAAFSTLVAAFSESLILPIVGIFLGGGVDVGTLTIRDQVIDFTTLLNAVITFILTVAVIYFAFVLPLNKMRAKMFGPVEEEKAALTDEVALLTEIRDLLAREQGSSTSTT